MKQPIVDFDHDDERHWRALLACGHRQHVRHEPPMTRREWVLTKQGREAKIGTELNCRKCDDEAPPDI